MTREEKLALVVKFERAYEVVDGLVNGLSGEKLRFVPPIADAWSINDFLVHLLDADVAAAFRIRAAVAQPGFAVPVWDEEVWQARLGYDGEDGLACLKEAKVLRARLAGFLLRLVDEDWSAFYVQHPSRGKLDLAALVSTYRDHVAFHVPLIKRDLDALKAAGGR